MQKRENLFFLFFVLLILAISIFKFGKNPFFQSLSFLENATGYSQKIVFDIFNFPKILFIDNTTKLKEENANLFKKIVDQQNLIKENNALKDQFNTSSVSNFNLVPAKIIGRPNFLPGENFSESLILDKGERDNVKIGQAVIFKDNLIGKIIKVSSTLSKVMLVTDSKSMLSAKPLLSNALGVAKGQGNGEIILDNVLLSESLKISDIVVSLGDMDENGLGYPANLIVGQITSIDKKPSSLFQSAKINNTLDFSTLSIVFIIQGIQ